MRTGVILAGGRNERMGFDKCTISFNGQLLIQHTYQTLNKVTDEIIISISKTRNIKELGSLANENVIFIVDDNEFLGPLTGFRQSFLIAQSEYVAVAPCDSPFINPEIYKLLFELAEGHDAAVPKIGGHWEPLHAVYRKEATLTAIEKVFSKNQYKTTGIYEHMNVREITEEELRSLDPELKSFININTENDIALLQ